MGGKLVDKRLCCSRISEYDLNGNIVHAKSSDGDEKWFEYDSNGNEIHWKTADGMETHYEYDAAGNLIH